MVAGHTNEMEAYEACYRATCCYIYSVKAILTKSAKKVLEFVYVCLQV